VEETLQTPEPNVRSLVKKGDADLDLDLVNGDISLLPGIYMRNCDGYQDEKAI
jgi:hypothetical protein